VVLAHPAGIIARPPNGSRGFYVAITRGYPAPQVVYERDLPAALRGVAAGPV
jgi:hypothetical protein